MSDFPTKGRRWRLRLALVPLAGLSTLSPVLSQLAMEGLWQWIVETWQTALANQSTLDFVTSVVSVVVVVVPLVGTASFTARQVYRSRATALEDTQNQPVTHEAAVNTEAISNAKANANGNEATSAALDETVSSLPFQAPPPSPYFTGREALLDQIHQVLNTGQPVALSGLGGIGKTQLAAAYAHRHRDDYTVVLWVRAETIEELISGFTQVAEALSLPTRTEADQNLILQQVRQFLETQAGWLLVLDNADYLPLVRDWLTLTTGHLLLTTRAAVTRPLAQSIDVNTMPTDEGALFLLRRCEQLAADAPLSHAEPTAQAQAQALCKLLGGLPLALDQAGAFILETPSSLEEYQTLYQQAGPQLLAQRGDLAPDHPDSVTVAFTLAAQVAAERLPATADLLQLCSFLAPESIPETLLSEGATVLAEPLKTALGDPLQRVPLLREAGKFSLLERDVATKSLSLHRLGQAVIRSNLSPDQQQAMAVQVVELVNAGFPNVEFSNWPQCEVLLPHGVVAAEWSDRYGIESEAAGRLFNEVGSYLYDRGRYGEAELLILRSLAIREAQLGPDHPSTASSLSNLAKLYESMGRYGEAEPLYERSLAIREAQLGPDHPSTASSLNNLAALYFLMGRYSEAESLVVRSLAIKEAQLGPDHPSTASSLNNLASLYESMGRYGEAEPLYSRSLVIREAQLGPDHPSTASSLNNLAGLYESMGRYGEAEPLYERSLAIREAQLGPDHPSTASSLNNLAGLYESMGCYGEAEPLYERSLAIREAQLGADHPSTATSLNNLAGLYESMGRYGEAEPLHVRSLAIREAQLGADHPGTATSLNNLAGLYESMGRYGEAEPLYERALSISEAQLGADHPDTATSLNNLALLYKLMSRHSEAEPLFVRSLSIREAQLGADHPNTAQSLNNLAYLYESMGRYDEAEPLYMRSLSIREAQLGASHPATATSLNNLAYLYKSMGRYGEAEPLYVRSLSIREAQLGVDHPDTKITRNNLTTLRQTLNPPPEP